MLVAVVKVRVGCAILASEVIQCQPESYTSPVHTYAFAHTLAAREVLQSTFAAQLAANVAAVNLPQLTTQESP